MQSIKIVSTFILCLFFTKTILSQSGRCTYCKMDIKNDLFRAKVETDSGKVIHFDAIECLVNYLKTKDGGDNKNVWVTDYRTGQFINAADAYYLKSNAIPSPMGANLSAFSSEPEAVVVQKEKGGKIRTWKSLKERFESSNFGAVDHSHHHNRPDAYAPSGIMGDHLHPKGGFMVSLRYMNMKMNGNREGHHKITDDMIYERFMVAPQDMTMHMYMLGVMYAPSDKLTLMLMQNFVKKNMGLTARMMIDGGMPMLRDFSTSAAGSGDLKLGFLYGPYPNKKTTFHLNLGLNVPVGNIEHRDATPMMEDAKLPYAMQLGSGTFDLTFGGTLKGSGNKFSWGLQQLNTFRTGTNKQHYRIGNLYELHSWLGYGISGKVSTSLRVSGSSEGTIKGGDPELNPMMVTTANTDNYGGEMVRGAIGLNLLLANSKLLLGGEIETPLYQNYSGICMDVELTVNACAKYTVF